MTRDEINAFGERITAELLEGDRAVLVMVGAHAPSADCPITSAVAVVRGGVGSPEGQDFTGNAIALHDAILIARGKLRDARAAFERAKAKEPTHDQ